MRDIMRNFYKNLFLEEIGELNEKKNLLLHSCCGPCSSYVIEYLSEWFNITVLYYNPNISPYEEYEKRKMEQINLINNFEGVNFIDSEYDDVLYEEAIKGLEKEREGGSRCKKCFLFRLEKCAKIAKEYNFDYFCTTLTVSPYKNCKDINDIGSFLSNAYGVKWLYCDFKKDNGYKRSIELSHKYGLYRQNYCGCKYSKREVSTD